MNSEKVFIPKGIIQEIKEQSLLLRKKGIGLPKDKLKRLKKLIRFSDDELSDQLERFIKGEIKPIEEFKKILNEEEFKKFNDIIQGYINKGFEGTNIRALKWAWSQEGKAGDGAVKDLRDLLCYFTYNKRFYTVISEHKYPIIENDICTPNNSYYVSVTELRNITNNQKRRFLKNKLKEEGELTDDDINYDTLTPTENREKEQEKKEEAERHWQYIQNHPITELEITFLLKSSVGYKWLVELLYNTLITLSKGIDSHRLSDILKNSPKPNTKEENKKKSVLPNSSFWEIYEYEEGFWCKRINPEGRSFNLIAGFSVSIPWSFFNIPKIINLQDLSICDNIGISFTPQVFQAGIEEVILNISGETYSFSTFLSEETHLETLHQLASKFHSMDLKESVPLNFAISLSGVNLLDIFHKQQMPGYGHAHKKGGIMMGLSGPKGNAIFFYPSVPKGFNETKEFKEFSFTIPANSVVNYDKIVKELEKKIDANNNDIDNYIKLASLYSMQYRFQDVIKLLTKTGNNLIPNSQIYALLASAYGALGCYNDAVNNFKESALLNTSDSEIQNSLALCLEELGDHETAIQHFKNAVNINPSNASFQYNLCRALVLSNRISEAVKYAEKAVNLDPENIEYNITFGVLLGSFGKEKEAFHWFDKAVKLDSTSAEACKYYGQILANMGETEKAIEYYKRSNEIKKDVDCYIALGGLLINTGRCIEAEFFINEGLSIDQNNSELLNCLGVMKANQNKFEEALDLFEKVKIIDPENKNAIKFIKQIKEDIITKPKIRKKK